MGHQEVSHDLPFATKATGGTAAATLARRFHPSMVPRDLHAAIERLPTVSATTGPIRKSSSGGHMSC